MLSAVTVVRSSLALQEEWGEESWETCRQVQACSLMPVIAPFAFCGADRQWQTRLKLPQQQLQQQHACYQIESPFISFCGLLKTAPPLI